MAVETFITSISIIVSPKADDAAAKPFVVQWKPDDFNIDRSGLTALIQLRAHLGELDARVAIAGKLSEVTQRCRDRNYYCY